jgi:hypothetical protein
MVGLTGVTKPGVEQKNAAPKWSGGFRFWNIKGAFMSYVSEIADLFLRRCLKIKILTPADFTAIVEWEKQEIPMSVVQESICAVCDEESGGSHVDSIADIQETVKDNFMHWLQVNEA